MTIWNFVLQYAGSNSSFIILFVKVIFSSTGLYYLRRTGVRYMYGAAWHQFWKGLSANMSTFTTNLLTSDCCKWVVVIRFRSGEGVISSSVTCGQKPISGYPLHVLNSWPQKQHHELAGRGAESCSPGYGGWLAGLHIAPVDGQELTVSVMGVPVDSSVEHRLQGRLDREDLPLLEPGSNLVGSG